jgi:hypothetical protein
MSIIIYLLIGTIVGFTLESLNNLNPNPIKSSTTEKIVSILIWPVTVLIFLYYFFKSLK